MVKKGVFLMSFFAVALILGSGAEAVKNKLELEEGQRRLYECNGIPLKARAKMRAVAFKQMNQQQREEELRKFKKEKANRDAQRLRDYLLKVDTKK